MIDPLAELVFEAHGIAVRVRSATVAGSAVVTLLKQDFERFDASLSREPVIQIDIESELPRGPRAIPLFRNRMCRVSGWSQVRRCEYGGVTAQARTNGAVRKFVVSGTDEILLREVCYTAILSALGEELDVRGVHRIHAFGFETPAGTRGLVVAPSGAGKSALALLLCLRQAKFRLFSDESPLLKGRIVSPFPTRIAIAPEIAGALGMTHLANAVFKRKKISDKIPNRLPVFGARATGSAGSHFVREGCERRPQKYRTWFFRRCATLVPPHGGWRRARANVGMDAQRRQLRPVAKNRVLPFFDFASDSDFGAPVRFEIGANAIENATRFSELVWEHESGAILSGESPAV